MSPAQQSQVSADRPFPGLRPFAYQDHDFFFGRDEQIFALYRLVDRNPFIAVIGSSGSGKSSLVRAGLLPLLDRETAEACSRHWLWREMRPGNAPLRRLAQMLASLSDTDDPIIASALRDRIASHLRRSSFGVTDAVREIGGLDATSIVLVIDQFEELFRYAAADAEGAADQARARDEAAQFVQLLLGATRNRTVDVRVLLTMRSDFIGDCARFYGLPEAVSATQFLVPSLTRDQLEAVVREPIEKAGATIEPELVEQLLNDCSSEAEQLPVMQHCLQRLWEESGRGLPAPDRSGTGADAATAGATPAAPAHHLTIAHYRAVGGFADALSWHADEILKDLPGPKLQMAVEQTFRALAELDKQGRAVRRALPFAQLLAETGVAEFDLRQVLDRFRADDCSFLLPSYFDEPVIQDQTRIDVGHEALLRRWEKVSGRGADVGWLRSEQRASERYRALLAIADSGNTLPPHVVAERWDWWKSKPRTPAWADRYGGGFDRVQKLLSDSQRWRRLKRLAVAASLVFALALSGLMFLLWQRAEQATARAEEATQNAQHNHETALAAVLGSTEKLLDYLNDGTIAVKSAGALLDDARKTLDNLESVSKSQQQRTAETGTRLLITMSDVRVALGEHEQALALAQRAKKIAAELLARDPANPELAHLVYKAAFRIGDELEYANKIDAAETEHKEAFEIARSLATRFPGDPERQRSLAFIINKLGDIDQSRREPAAAISRYQDAMAIIERLVAEQPSNPEWSRETAVSRSRIGQVLMSMGDYAGALGEFRAALDIQTRLADQQPDNVIMSHLATTHRRIGEALRREGSFDAAVTAYEGAIAIRDKLSRKDPSNTQWQSGLATDHGYVAEVYELEHDWPRAESRYRIVLQIREGLAFKDTSNPGLARSLATAYDKLARVLAEQDKLDEALVQQRKAVGILKDLSGQPAETATVMGRRRDLFMSHLDVGDLLVRQGKHAEAVAAFRKAQALAESAATSVTGRARAGWQLRLSTVLEKVGDALAAAGTADQARAEYQAAFAAADSAARLGADDDRARRQLHSVGAKLAVMAVARDNAPAASTTGSHRGE